MWNRTVLCMLVSYIYVNVYIKWFWLHQYVPYVVLIILMYISHSIMLYIALLKLRLVIKFIRNFNMIPCHADPRLLCPRAHCQRSAGLRWRYLSLECVCAHALESGTALSKHIPSSGRMLVWKGGVSFPAPFQPQTHTVTVGGGALPWILGCSELSLSTFDCKHKSCYFHYDILLCD